MLENFSIQFQFGVSGSTTATGLGLTNAMSMIIFFNIHILKNVHLIDILDPNFKTVQQQQHFTFMPFHGFLGMKIASLQYFNNTSGVFFCHDGRLHWETTHKLNSSLFKKTTL